MAGYGKRQDLIDQVRYLQEQVRWMQTRRKPVVTHTKTFLVSGTVPAGFQTPPFIVSTFQREFPDDPSDPAEQRFPQDVWAITAVAGTLLDGEATVDFYLNSTPVYTGYNIPDDTGWKGALAGTRPGVVANTLADGDRLSVVVTAADGLARDLSAAFRLSVESWG